MSVYDVEVRTLEGEPASLADHRGEVLLVVNVASRCGYTPQYRGLQALQERYGDDGFTVLGFPCNQFMGQEPGTAQEIREFCTAEYAVTFPLFEKTDVNGPGRHPLYAILADVPDFRGRTGDIGWNFEKFLVGRDGTPVQRFSMKIAPDDPRLIDAIEAALRNEGETP